MSGVVSRRRLREALETSALKHGVSIAEIVGPSMFRRIVHARWEVMWMLREADFSFPAIGRAMAMDHSSIIHGCRKHAAMHGLTPTVFHRAQPAKRLISPQKPRTVHRLPDPNQPRVKVMRKPRPTRALVRDVAADHALACGVDAEDVMGSSTVRIFTEARKAAWQDLIQRGYGMSAIADAWGCNRASIRRAKRELIPA